jgi:hypothetical protein
MEASSKNNKHNDDTVGKTTKQTSDTGVFQKKNEPTTSSKK